MVTVSELLEAAEKSHEDMFGQCGRCRLACMLARSLTLMQKIAQGELSGERLKAYRWLRSAEPGDERDAAMREVKRVDPL